MESLLAPKLNGDRTVDYWSVYEQRWIKQASCVPDREYAAMSEAERNKVLTHLGVNRESFYPKASLHMNFDTDTNVYQIKANGIDACGFVKYGMGEFYSDEFNFSTISRSQAGSIRQLGEWMTSMEEKGYKFLSAEEVIDSLPST